MKMDDKRLAKENLKMLALAGFTNAITSKGDHTKILDSLLILRRKWSKGEIEDKREFVDNRIIFYKENQAVRAALKSRNGRYS